MTASHRPRGIVLENVKGLLSVVGGEILRDLIRILTSHGYTTDYRVLNALDFGLPQRRERIFIVATLKHFDAFPWPTDTLAMTPLAEVLEPNPPSKYNLPEYYRQRMHRNHSTDVVPAMWVDGHSDRKHIRSRPYSYTLRAGRSGFQKVDGKRNLTPRECLRLQGFPDTFEIVCSDNQTYKQTGNAVAVPVAQAVIKSLADVLEPNPPPKYNLPDEQRQRILREYSADTKPSMFKRAFGGGISSIRPYAFTLTAKGSHDQYVNGTRRLTPLEALRLQGFPSSFEIVCSGAQTFKQAGNAVAVPVAQAVIKSLADVLEPITGAADAST